MEQWVAGQNIERLRRLISAETDMDRRRTLERLLVEQEAVTAKLGDRAAEAHERIKRWRAKAEELRTVADQLGTKSAQADLRRLAADYETLADEYPPAAHPQRKPEASR